MNKKLQSVDGCTELMVHNRTCQSRNIKVSFYGNRRKNAMRKTNIVKVKGAHRKEAERDRETKREIMER